MLILYKENLGTQAAAHLIVRVCLIQALRLLLNGDSDQPRICNTIWKMIIIAICVTGVLQSIKHKMFPVIK